MYTSLPSLNWHSYLTLSPERSTNSSENPPAGKDMQDDRIDNHVFNLSDDSRKVIAAVHAKGSLLMMTMSKVLNMFHEKTLLALLFVSAGTGMGFVCINLPHKIWKLMPLMIGLHTTS
jgi:hypothetical protein